MRDGDDEEAVTSHVSRGATDAKMMIANGRMTYLLLSSAIPARALYHAVKAASRPKKPPALMIGGFGLPAWVRWR